MNKRFRKIVSNLTAHECEVNIQHTRTLYDPDQPAADKNLCPKGGVTYVSVRVPGKYLGPLHPNMVKISGISRCSMDETFCRDTGVNTAFKRMLRRLHNIVGRDVIKTLVADVTPKDAPPDVTVIVPDNAGNSRSLLAVVS